MKADRVKFELISQATEKGRPGVTITGSIKGTNAQVAEVISNLAHSLGSGGDYTLKSKGVQNKNESGDSSATPGDES